MVVVAIGCFALLHGRLSHTAARSTALAQARMVAACLDPQHDGDLSHAITRLLDRYDGVLAIATLDATGGLHTVYPERPAHRTALDRVRATLTPGGSEPSLPVGAAPVSVMDPLTGTPIDAYGAVATLNGSDFPDARRIAVLLRSPKGASTWMTATTIFAAPVAAAGLACVLSLTGWFHRRVAQPLRSMASSVAESRPRYHRRRGDNPTAWRETSAIASMFDDLMRGLSESDAARKRVVEEAERSLAQRETEHQRSLRRANDRAVTDRLTGLRNRAFLEENLESTFEGARRDGVDLSAVVIDLDNFKTHNDTHGHQAGDQLLRFVGALLAGSIRHEDYAIRFGGDEFVLLLPGCDNQRAGAIAERIVKMFGQYARRMGKATNVSLSAGVASIKSDGATTGHDLVARADAALYTAKRVGKNTVAFSQAEPQGVT